MRLCRPLRLFFSTANTPRPAAPEPSINIGSIPSLKIPNAEHHAILGVDRNTNVEEIKKQYITRTKLYSSRTPTIIEKESQMRALQESYDVMTSYYHLAEIRELPEGNFTKYELIGMLVERERMKKLWSEPWWIRELFYALIFANGMLGLYII